MRSQAIISTLIFTLLLSWSVNCTAQASPTPTPTATPCPLVTARLTQVSSHLVIACTVKDSTGLPVPSKIVSVQKAPAVTGPFAVWMSKKTNVNGRALLPYVPPTYTWYVRCAAACTATPQLVSAINAGGGAAGAFGADTSFSGGATFSYADPINTSGVTNPAPQAVYNTERYGSFTYTMPNLTPGATYAVRLHFAEIYWSAAGQRVFNVAINGSPVLSNFDIFATAGGKDIAVVKQFTAAADSSGKITIRFTTVTDNAKVGGIEVLATDSVSRTLTIKGQKPRPSPTATPRPTATATPRPTVTPVPTVTPTATPKPTATPQLVSAINAGGGAAGAFGADTSFSGGATFSYADPINTSGVTNPAPQAVYNTERYGSFTYTMPNLTPGATYAVRLHFAEIYWSAAGQRVFNVAINGSPVLSNFDIFATAGGKDIAVVKEFSTTAGGFGTIAMQFTTVTDNAKISGIEVLATDPSPAPTVTPTATPQPTGGLPSPIAGTNYHLVWSDEFNGTSVDASKWDLVGWGIPFGSHWANFSYNESANVSVANGALALTARNTGGGPGGTWQGAMLSTQSTHTWQYGFWEVRAKLPPKGPGFWSGIWMFGGGSWDELDLMEWLGRDVSTVYQTYHFDPANSQQQVSPKSSDWTTDYHLFQMKWEPGRITYYVDNVQTASWTQSVPARQMYFMFNFDVGGPNDWSGAPDSSTPTTATYNVDYVRIYQQS